MRSLCEQNFKSYCRPSSRAAGVGYCLQKVVTPVLSLGSFGAEPMFFQTGTENPGQTGGRSFVRVNAAKIVTCP